MRMVLPLSLLLLASAAAAQRTPSFAVAADFGPAIPLGDFADDGAELGWALNLSATARLTRLFGVYGSWERTSFGVEDGDENWMDTGFGFGGKVWLPVAEDARLHPWAQLGVGWHDLDPLLAGPLFADVDTDGIVTLEGGAGVDVAIRRNDVFIRPTLRYRRYGFDVEAAGETTSTSVSSLTLALGVVFVLAPRGGD